MQNLPASLTAHFKNASVTTSFVVDENGSFTSAAGSSKGLGNETDLELLKSLRAHSEVVLTSGLTARLENYRMPRHADLAIFTKAGVQGMELKPRAGQKLQLLSPPIVNSYQQALSALQTKYQAIHVEFGPTGVAEIAAGIDLFVVSSVSPTGAEIFLHGLKQVGAEQFELPGLFVTLAFGRG